MPLGCLRVNSSLVPRQVLGQLLSLLHYQGCHSCLRSEKTILFTLAVAGPCCRCALSRSAAMLGGAFLPCLLEVFLPCCSFPCCAGTTEVSKASRKPEQNLSPKVTYKDNLEFLKHLGTALALLIKTSQVKRASLCVSWKKTSESPIRNINPLSG